MPDIVDEKNTRDRFIMNDFVVCAGDKEDLYVICRECQAMKPDEAMEFLPNGTTGLSIYYVMRGHWDKHHAPEKRK